MRNVSRYISTLWTLLTDPKTKDAVRDLAQRLEALARDVPDGSAGGAPSGMIIFFDGPACPTGYTAVAAAQSRVLRGMPAGGTPGQTGGSDTHAHDINHTHGGSTSTNGAHQHSISTVADHQHNVGFQKIYSYGGGDFGGVSDVYATGSAGGHNHGGFTGSQGDHAHTLNISSGGGTSGSAGNIPAFIQYLVCRKD